MRIADALKRIKKKLRRKRSWMLASILFLLSIMVVVAVSEAAQAKTASPSFGHNTYFGIDDNDQLTLFDGKPQEGEIIRPFFKLNVEYLENSLPEDRVNELREGIHVTDSAEFDSVLSTYSDYAWDETE